MEKVTLCNARDDRNKGKGGKHVENKVMLDRTLHLILLR